MTESSANNDSKNASEDPTMTGNDSQKVSIKKQKKNKPCTFDLSKENEFVRNEKVSDR